MQQLFILLTFGESNTYQEKHKRCCNNPFSQKIKCDQMTSLRQFPSLFLWLLGPFPWFVGSAGCLGRLGRLGLLCLRPWRCRWRLLGADLRSCSCREAQLGIGELLKGCNPWSKNGKGLLFVSKISQSLDVFFESFKVLLVFKYRSSSKATSASMFKKGVSTLQNLSEIATELMQ